MANPTRSDWFITTGDTTPRYYPVYDGSGAAISSTTNYAASAVARDLSGTLIKTWSSATLDVTTDPTSGLNTMRAQLSFSTSDYSSITVDVAKYDLQITDPNGEINTLYSGYVYFTGENTT